MAVLLSLIMFFLVFQYQHDLSKAQGMSCNAELTAQTYPQTLLSPNFPLNYTNNLHCVIHITAIEGTAIEVEFITFDLEEEEDCEKDVLVVYDGIDDGQRLIQHSCGPHFAWPHFPDAVRSSSNAITLVFITDGNQTGKGYEARFKTVAQEPSIFVLAAHDKNRLHVIRRHSALNYGLVPDGIQSPQAVDYDPVEGFVYYSDIATKVIGKLPVLGGETEILHKKQISNPFALRVDIVNRLLYWSDADMATISVSNLEGTQRQTLIDSELHMPGAVVQEPNEGYIYFTDWGHPAKIEAAAGDGTLRTPIVTERISSPQGLTIDLNRRLLYWVDTLLDTLEMVSVSGQNRQILRQFHERDPFSLVLDNEAFFFTDEEWGAIELHDRESRTAGFRVYIGSIREPRGLTLRPLHDYGDTVPYTCPRADCNGLCLPKPNNFYVCSQVKPVLLSNCPNDIMQTSPINRVSVTWTEPIAYSPKGLDITTTKSNSPGEEFRVGIHHVSYEFEDTLCNRVYCNFTVSIIAPHMIICPEDIYKKVPKGVTEVEVLWVPPTDTQGRPATSSTHSPGAMFSLGTTVVTYSATYDNIYEECSFSIFVEQVESPGPVFLNCPSSIVKWVKKGETFAFVSWSSIELADKAHIIDENHWMENGGNFFTDSVEIVHLRARDEFDNVADCNFTVEVKVDDEKPQITNCPQDISIRSTKDREFVDWREPSASDNSGSVNITLEDGPSPGSTIAVGLVTVTYLAQDPYGNAATCTFIVEVSVAAPHMIFCPEDIYKKVPKGVIEVEVLWVPPTDTQGRPATSSTHSPGAMFSLGTTVVTYSATYDNIYEECSFSIFVEQVEIPGPVFLNCPSSIEKWVKKGETFAFVSWSSIELVDEAHIIDENHWMENGGKFFTDSVEIVHLRARDEFDNVADCNFTVEVKVDDEKPQITNCPKDISIRSTKDREFVDWREPSASDNSGSVNITLEDGPSPGSTIAVGSMTVTYLAQDPYGNAATCTFIVEVSVADAGLPSGIDAQNSVKVSGNDNDLNMLLIIIIGSAIAALLLLILCALVFLLYRCRRKPAREIQRTNSLPPEYNYAVAEPVNSVSLGVSGGRVQYRVAVPDDEPLYDTAAVGLPPAYEEEKKVDLADEKDIPPGYQ